MLLRRGGTDATGLEDDGSRRRRSDGSALRLAADLLGYQRCRTALVCEPFDARPRQH